MAERTRIDGLAGLDPAAVPLPTGTDVATTVDRPTPDGARVVPQGAVGRVVAIDGARVTVRIVGVGPVEYARHELRPRRAGQLRFASRRAEAEAALAPCRVLVATVGSRAWGLSDEGSDTDRRGVFLWPFEWTSGLADPPDVVVSADGSETYWELERVVRQALRADPNTLEMLFVPEIEVRDEVGEALLRARDAFPSMAIYGAFGRYALSQAKRLDQSRRLAEHRVLVLEWLRADPDLSLDAIAARLARETLGGEDKPRVLRAKDYVKQLYRSLHDQGRIPRNELSALVELARDPGATLDLPRELRPKNAYNLLRLVATAVRWLETGAPSLVVEGELRDRLWAIKRGEVPLATALAWTEAEAKKLERARAHSRLPAAPDLERADALLRHARQLAAQRWLDAEPGPWGSDAPPPPAPGPREGEEAPDAGAEETT
jgi:hypothetical protein